MREGGRVAVARWGVAYGALAAALLITTLAHSYFIRPYAPPVTNDEGYIAAMALRMVHGHWLPYVDGVSQRGPLLYWLGALVMRVGGLYSWTPLRVLSLGLALGNTAFLFLLGVELLSPFAAGIAVLVQTYFLTFELEPSDGLAYNGEVLGVQFVLISALLVARCQTRAASPPNKDGHRRRAWSLAAAGVLAACAGLSKQVTLVHLGPSLLWLVLGPRHVSEAVGEVTPASRPRRWVDVGVYLGGFFVPFGLVLAVYAAAGHLRELVYYYQRYGREIFMAPLTREVMKAKLREQLDLHLLVVMTVGLITLLAVARAWRALLATTSAGWGTRLRANAPCLFLLSQFVVALLGASFTWRFFPHYFVQVFPFLGLLAAYALSEPFEGTGAELTTKAVGGAVVVAGAAVLLGLTSGALHHRVVTLGKRGQWARDPRTDPMVRYVAETTEPSDTIFVWGFRADLHVSAHRDPASRYVYSVYPAGVVPWFHATREEEESRVVPGSRERLLVDLEASKPELIVDAGRTMDGRYMFSIPILRDYLDKEYCFVRHIDGEPIYRRRHEADCPPPDALQ